MIRIAGVSLKENQQVRFALTNVKGVGKNNVKVILNALEITFNTKMGDLDEEKIVALRNHLEENYVVEADLEREVRANIKRLKDIKSWRGGRHRVGMPTRGQRTKTNSRTVRGNKRNTAGSGKANSAQKT